MIRVAAALLACVFVSVGPAQTDKEGAVPTRTLQVIRNYQNATRTAGGQVLSEHNDGSHIVTTLRLTREGKEVWILLDARDDAHWITLVERQAMQQDGGVEQDGGGAGQEPAGGVGGSGDAVMG